MVELEHAEISVRRQCELLEVNRPGLYYQRVGESAENLGLMVEIDRQFLETPFYGAQQMTWHLQAAGQLGSAVRSAGSRFASRFGVPCRVQRAGRTSHG